MSDAMELQTRAEVVAQTAPSLLDKVVEQQAAIASRYKPVMSIDELLQREKAITYLVENVMREGVDYGWVPGTKPSGTPKPGEYVPKPTLFKAGAERACAFFGYAPDYEETQVIEEWTADKYGEMLFYYTYRCTLRKDGAPVGQGLGAATTWESKYRYRNSERVCPSCGAGAIIKGKAEYGGGWICFARKGGCGAKFAEDDSAVADQQIGKVANADVADVINTVQKMGQKRAYVAATLTATGLSGRFTQDLEDMPSAPERRREEKREPEQKPKSEPAAADEIPAPVKALWDRVGSNIAKAVEVCHELLAELEVQHGGEKGRKLYTDTLVTYGNCQKSNQFKTVALTRRTILELWKLCQSKPEPEMKPESFVAGDDDIPAIIGGKR